MSWTKKRKAPTCVGAFKKACIRSESVSWSISFTQATPIYTSNVVIKININDTWKFLNF